MMTGEYHALLMRLQQSLQANTLNALDVERASKLAQAIYWTQLPPDLGWTNRTASSLTWWTTTSGVPSLHCLVLSGLTPRWTCKASLSQILLTKWRSCKRSILQLICQIGRAERR